MNRIEDVLYADNVAQDPSLLAKKKSTSARVRVATSEDSNETPDHSPGQTPTESMTLSDFMGWSIDQEQEESNTKNGDSSPKQVEENENEKYQSYSARILARTKNSYMEKLGGIGLRSPTTRH